MVGSARQIVVEFLGDSKGLNRAIGEADSSSSKLGSKLSKVGKIAAVGLGGGVVVAGKALVDMTKGAIDDEAAAAKLSNTLQKAAGATKGQVAQTEDWISAQGKAYGVTDDELRPALSKLVTATHDVGKAQQLAKLAMDVSAGSGKSLESVTQSLMKAQNGSTAGLAKFGIKTKDSEKDTAALQSAQIALTKAHEDYTAAVQEFGPKSKEAQDAAAKLEYRQTKLGEAQQKTKSYTIDFDEATQRLTKTWQGSAKTAAETTAGKMQRLKVMLSETGEAIGYKLIPVVVAVADFILNKLVPAVGKASEWFHKNLMPSIRRIGEVVKGVFGGMDGNVSGPLKDVISTVKSAVSIIQSLWKRFGGILTSYAKGTFKNVFAIVKGAFKVIAGIFKVFSSLLKGDWKGVWQGIKMILSGAFAVIKGLIKQALNVIKTLFKIGWSALKGIVSGVWDGIKSLVSNGIGRVVDLVRSLPGRIRDVGGNMLDAGKSLIGKLFDGILSAAKNAGGFVGDLVSSIKSAINNALNLPLEINFDKGPIHIHATLIPAFAKGTNFAPGGLSLVGEEGPELVNLPRGSRVRTAAQTQRALGSGDTYVINIYGVLTEEQAGRKIEQVLTKHFRTTGRRPAFG